MCNIILSVIRIYRVTSQDNGNLAFEAWDVSSCLFS